MIQRIQTIFLFLSACCFGALFALPFASHSGETTGIFTDQLYNIQDNIGLMIIAGIGAAISLATIFAFKNRNLQKNLSLLSSILSIGLIAFAGFLLYPYLSADQSSGAVNYKLGFGLPLLALIFSFLAVKFIKKDDALVKSMDRLR